MEYKNKQSIQLIYTWNLVFGTFHLLILTRDSNLYRNGKYLIYKSIKFLQLRNQKKKNNFKTERLTWKYIKLSGKLIAIDNNQTKVILMVTRLRVLLRPNRIGYLRDRYRSIDIVHKCMMLAVENNTSRHIHAKQWTDSNGKWPLKKIQKKKIQIYNNQFQKNKTKIILI